MKRGRGQFYSAFRSGRMFNEADVYGSSCEQAAGEHRHEFGDLAHQSPLSKVKAPSTSLPRLHESNARLMSTQAQVLPHTDTLFFDVEINLRCGPVFDYLLAIQFHF